MKTNHIFLILLIGLTLVFVGCNNQESEQQIQQLQTQLDAVNQENQDLQSQAGNLQTQVGDLQSSLVDVNLELDEKTYELLDVVEDWEQERNCLIENYENFGDSKIYASGQIIVSFVEGTTKEEVEEIVDSYGLTSDSIIKTYDGTYWGTIDIVDDEEIQWVCKLGLHDKIEYATLDVLVSAT